MLTCSRTTIYKVLFSSTLSHHIVHRGRVHSSSVERLCVCKYERVCVYECMCVCVYVCMCVCEYVCVLTERNRKCVYIFYFIYRCGLLSSQCVCWRETVRFSLRAVYYPLFCTYNVPLECPVCPSPPNAE